MDPDPNEQTLLNKVGRGGWTVIGRKPETQDVSSRDANNNPVTIQQPTGNIIWTITDGKGRNQQMTVAGGIPNANVGDVVKPPSDLPSSGNETSDTSKWTPVYRTPGDPSSGQIGQWDPSNNTFHPVAADPGAKASGKYDNVIDPNDSSGKRIIGMVDTGDKTWHPIATTADGKQVVTTPSAIYSYDKDSNQLTKLTDVAKDSPFQVVSYPDGSVYRFDPNEKDPSKAFTAMPTGAPKQIKDSQGNTMLLNEDTGGYEYPKGVTPAATVSSNTTAKVLTWYGPNGEVIAQHDNPAYQPTPAQAPPPNTVAPYIQIPDPDHPSKLIWVENKGRVTASQALKDLATHLTGQVVSGDISVDDAKALIDASNSRMQVEAQQGQTAGTAAGDILRNTQQGATTAAGLLQNRAQLATTTLQGILGQTLGNKNVTSYAPDTAANLVQGLQGWTASLMGGQATMDSAARMVQMADPKSSLADPSTQTAIGTLTQMLDKYRQLTGGPHPIEQATQSAQQSQQQGGLIAPVTAQAQATQAVQPVQAVQAVGAGFTPPGGSSYTYPSVPWAGATPQTLPTQAANLAGAGVGQGFRAPTIVINAGGG
jgi:hypothetical protein